MTTHRSFTWRTLCAVLIQHTPRLRGCIAVALTAGLAASAAGATVTYRVIQLPSLGSGWGEGIAINNHNQIAGRSNDKAALWDDAGVHQLGDGYPFDINEKGWVVGQTLNNVACYWDESRVLHLLPTVGQLNSARTINNNGVMGGFTETYPHEWGCLWDQNGVHQLPSYGNFSGIRCLNDSGIGSGQADGTNALRWTGSAWQLLPTLGPSLSVGGINQAGTIVGGTGGYAVYWDQNGLHKIGKIAGYSSTYGNNINNHGIVVGGTVYSGSYGRAWVWDGTTMQVFDPLPGGEFSDASDINDNGWIVGMSGTYGGAGPVAVLWVPNTQPPVCHAGGPYTAECGGAVTTIPLDGTGSSDPNGSALSFHWTSDCACGSFDNAASPKPTLIFNSANLPESCSVTLTVSNAFGFASTCTATVSTKDTLPPILTCPAAPVVEFANETGATVPFSATATDLCSAVTITCVPPSGSLFPIGVTPVSVRATDAATNSAQCTFDVTVLGARGVKSNVLAGLVALRTGTTNRFDCWELDQAIEDMIDALGLDTPAAPRWVQNAHRPLHCRTHHRPPAALWLDETHVTRDGASWVFDNEKDTVKELVEIIKSRKSRIPDATAQGFIGRLVKCDRLLAVVSIQDAAKAGARQKRIDQARIALAQGDRDAAAGRPVQAVEGYWRAWFFAAFAAPE